MAGLNNIAYTTLTTSTLIADVVQTTGASVDSIPLLSQDEGGNTVTAAVEIQSTTGGLLFPRMTNAQMLAIDVPLNGMEVFNTDYDAKFIYVNGWTPSALITNTFILSSAQLKALHGTPITLLAAPGAGLMFVLKSVEYEYLYVAPAYTIGAVGNFVIDQGAVAINIAFAATGFIDQTVGKVAYDIAPAIASTSTTSLANQAITVTNSSATEWTLGNGTVHITLTYGIVAV